jgi:tyrosyl-tRNA synthetase
MNFDSIIQGTADIFSKEELEKKFASGMKLRVKFGVDPTSPDIHLGHFVALRKLRQFQDLGHKVLLIIGDYTARIGDPTGRDKTRPELTEHEIFENAKTYIDQAGKVLDVSEEKLWIGHNKFWLGTHILNKIISSFTLQQLIHRKDLQKRLDIGNPITLIELLYPAFQAYDSMWARADIEIGGTDQIFNMQLGRSFQIKNDQDPQVVITVPLLVGLDGKEKMSKSKGNHVGIMDEPKDMFGKLMSVPDHLTNSYMELLTGDMRPIIKDPLARKEAMAHDVVNMFHGSSETVKAHEEFIRVFRNKELPTDIKVEHIGPGQHKLIDIIVKVGFVPSKNQARKLIEAGAVRLDGNKVEHPYKNEINLSNNPLILQVGKRRVCKLEE